MLEAGRSSLAEVGPHLAASSPILLPPVFPSESFVLPDWPLILVPTHGLLGLHSVLGSDPFPAMTFHLPLPLKGLGVSGRVPTPLGSRARGTREGAGKS